MKWIVYILRLRDNSLYCGITKDYAKRMQAHWAKRGSKYVASRLPILANRMVMVFKGRSAHGGALRLEAHIKRLRKDEKELWMNSYRPGHDYIRSLVNDDTETHSC